MARLARSPVDQAAGNGLDPLIGAVGEVLRAGLPIRPSTAPSALLALEGVVALSVKPEDRLGRVDALDRLLRRELRRFGLLELRDAAGVLFGLAKGGSTLTERRRLAAGVSGYEFDHFRKRIEPKVVEQLAWQLHQDSLQYIERERGPAPFAASGSTPVITEENLGPEAAEREALLSEVWSEVYGLRAELIRREGARDDADRGAEFEDAVGGSLWRLARLLTKLDVFLERYGDEILHGSASYNAEGLIRLAGWSGEVTAEQARELRYRLARAGEWSRTAFSHRGGQWVRSV